MHTKVYWNEKSASEVGHLTNPDTAAYAPVLCGKHAEIVV